MYINANSTTTRVDNLLKELEGTRKKKKYRKKEIKKSLTYPFKPRYDEAPE